MVKQPICFCLELPTIESSMDRVEKIAEVLTKKDPDGVFARFVFGVDVSKIIQKVSSRGRVKCEAYVEIDFD